MSVRYAWITSRRLQCGSSVERHEVCIYNVLRIWHLRNTLSYSSPSFRTEARHVMAIFDYLPSMNNEVKSWMWFKIVSGTIHILSASSVERSRTIAISADTQQFLIWSL